MSEITGNVRRTVNGSEYTMRMSMGGLAQLQEEFGQNFMELLQPPNDEDDDEGSMFIPPMRICLRIVEVALRKGMPKLDDDRVSDVADDILTSEPKIISEVMRVAFPNSEEVVPGKPKRARKKVA